MALEAHLRISVTYENHLWDRQNSHLRFQQEPISLLYSSNVKCASATTAHFVSFTSRDPKSTLNKVLLLHKIWHNTKNSRASIMNNWSLFSRVNGTEQKFVKIILVPLCMGAQGTGKITTMLRLWGVKPIYKGKQKVQ